MIANGIVNINIVNYSIPNQERQMRFIAILLMLMYSSCSYAQVKVQDLTEDTSPTSSDVLYEIKNWATTPTPRKVKPTSVAALSGFTKSGTTISTTTAGDNITTTGTVTGGYIVGDGSGLTNVPGSSTTPAGSGSEVQYRAGASSLGAITGSSVSGSTLTVTNLVGSTSVKVGSTNVCLSDGTNCPSAGSESDPVVKALTGVIKSNGSAISAVSAPSGTIVGTSDTQTLTNKTLTGPIISTISNTGTITLPTSTDTLVGKATTDTLTNKTLTAPTISAPTLTGAITAASATSLTIPNGAAPTVSAFGQIAGDNDIWASGRGAPLFYDGTAAVALVGTLATDIPTNGQVPTWSTGGTITWETPSSGSTTITCADTGIVYSDGVNNPVCDVSNFNYNKNTHVLTANGGFSTGSVATAGYLTLYEASANGTNYRKFRAADSVTGDATITLDGTDATTQTFPSTSQTLVGKTSTDTLTNKTLTSPIIGTGITVSSANIITDTSTGTKIGTSTSQKLGFYNATPIVQPTGNVCTALQNLGIVASCTETSGLLTAGTGSNAYLASGNLGVGGDSTGGRIEITGSSAVTDFNSVNTSGSANAIAYGSTVSAVAKMLTGFISGDSSGRFLMLTDGKTSWGPGSSGRDVYLYRSATNTLTLDSDGAGGTSGKLIIPNIKSTTGTRYVCVTTTGLITSSASACSGT